MIDMWASDIIDYGYESGTFKLGERIYHIHSVKHKFKFHKECSCCNSTGRVTINNKEYECPSCHCGFYYKEVTEKVVDNEICKVKSIISFKNKNKTIEIYTNDSSGYGLIIQKQKDGTNTYFKSKEEAQIVCDEYNNKNSVYSLLKEYRTKEIKERL